MVPFVIIIINIIVQFEVWDHMMTFVDKKKKDFSLWESGTSVSMLDHIANPGTPQIQVAFIDGFSCVTKIEGPTGI